MHVSELQFSYFGSQDEAKSYQNQTWAFNKLCDINITALRGLITRIPAGLLVRETSSMMSAGRGGRGGERMWLLD